MLIFYSDDDGDDDGDGDGVVDDRGKGKGREKRKRPKKIKPKKKKPKPKKKTTDHPEKKRAREIRERLKKPMPSAEAKFLINELQEEEERVGHKIRRVNPTKEKDHELRHNHNLTNITPGAVHKLVNPLLKDVNFEDFLLESIGKWQDLENDCRMEVNEKLRQYFQVDPLEEFHGILFIIN
jgi:hypothetical protein